MLTKEDAEAILVARYPDIRVEVGIDFEGDWLFRAFMPLGGGEENMNPFLTVDKVTGEDNDFSPMQCSDPLELARLFAIEDAAALSNKPATPQEALARANERR